MKFKHTNTTIERTLPKLIRDNIPSLIKHKEGYYPKVERAKNNKLFLMFLLKKLKEEASEASKGKNKEEILNELVDIEEVKLSICELLKINLKELEKIRVLKRKQNGAFAKRYILKNK